jgi:hypothetical protein
MMVFERLSPPSLLELRWAGRRAFLCSSSYDGQAGEEGAGEADTKVDSSVSFLGVS